MSEAEVFAVRPAAGIVSGRRRGAVAAWRRLPWWARVTAIFIGGRLIDTAMLLWLAAIEGANAWTAAHPGLLQFANIWDGRWYEIIAASGYPHQLPYDDTGHVAQNAWAFLPGYPLVVQLVRLATRMPWEAAAVFVTVMCAWGATLVFYKLMRLRLRPSQAMFTVVLFSVAPVAALYQVAYAESLYLLLLTAVLYLLLKRRYLVMIPFIVAAAFVRPSGLAVALLMGLHVLHRLWGLRFRGHAYPLGELAASVAATVAALVSGFAWPAIAAFVTGVPTAYTDTELSWRAAYLGYGGLAPFTPWFQGAKWWFTLWLHLPAWSGYAVLVLLILLFAALLLSPPARRLGVDLRLWLAAYGAYLLAVFFPQSSTFRVLLPMFPAIGVFAQPKALWYRIGIVVLAVGMQLGWLLICWIIGGYDWSPP